MVEEATSTKGDKDKALAEVLLAVGTRIVALEVNAHSYAIERIEIETEQGTLILQDAGDFCLSYTLKLNSIDK